MKPVLLDTGPFVALLDKRDRFHEWAVAEAAKLPSPLFTCESVLSEVFFLLQSAPESREIILEVLARNEVVLSYNVRDDLPAIGKLMRRYADVPMSLADACLVRMAESTAHARILTVDADFTVYRKHGRDMIPLILPPGVRR